MKNMRRLFAAFLTVVMLAGMLVGCGGPQGEDPTNPPATAPKETLPPVEEREVITISLALNTQTKDGEATHVHAYLLENFKINLEVTEYNSENWKDQLTLMLAEDNLPDIICNTGWTFSQFQEFVEDGYFLNLSPYLAQVPNLQAIFEQYPDYRQQLTSADGNIYGLSQLTTINQNAPYRGFIDERWLANVGKEVPRTVDELYEVLKAFKEQDANGNGDPNDEVPMYLSADYKNRNNTFRALVNAFGIYTDNPTRKMALDADGNLFAPWTTDNWKDLMKYCHKLYEEGLIDTNYVTRTSAEFKELIKTQTVGAFSANAPYAQAGLKIDYDANFQYMHPMTSQYSDKSTLVLTSGASTGVSFAMNANVDPEKAQRMCELINWIFTLDGAFGIGMGVQGLDWEYEYTQWSDEYGVLKMFCPEGWENSNEYKVQACIIHGAFSFYSPAEGRDYILTDIVSDEVLYNDEEFAKRTGWFNLVEQGIREADRKITSLADMNYTTEEASERAILVTDISSYVEQMITQFITGEADIDATWETYVNTLEQMDLDRWVEIDQAAYDRVK
jgi:putative aldouronate transport system substrate-binding protein